MSDRDGGVALSVAVSDHDTFESVLRDTADAAVASGIFAEDGSLWGEAAQDEASERLGWTDAVARSRPLVAEIESLRHELRERGVDRIVLCGMGGSSLAPEVICAAYGVELVVLDSSHPSMVRSALIDLERTAVVVSSKSGGTVETDSQRRVFEQAFHDASIDPASRIVVVTDPGSPLEELATGNGYRVFQADPTVGGRYSALTAFGLVPSGLAGAPIATLLDEAAAVRDVLAADTPDNPALRLGVLLGVAARERADKLVLADVSGEGFGEWAEQLVAESTGKDGTGILPVVVASPTSPNFAPHTGDSVLVVSGDAERPDAPWSAAVAGPLGARFLLWETAIAVAGRILGIDPFDQPDVESAKQAARDRLGGGTKTPAPALSEDGIDVFGTSASSLAGAVDELLAQLTSEGYLAVQAYLDRWEHAGFASVRDQLAEHLGRPVTFGWGPRFLHSTGQYHKGGAPVGVFVQITDETAEDLPIPGRDFTLGQFIASQAEGDASVLRDHGRPVLRLHLHDTAAGLERLRSLLA
ncbi:glucose-6-phosphate isomerase [Aeromicrobium sp. YIM 150415]|uniref:glucose-6-phosphate isomerase n=1 Tax=Aeromicrobium sp. YIM 150415 TaxID=2803912 RepID=UPI001963EC64|nr:glucose-6-phosphate isomerase [Aeromicrobium sp. YIM 150415]MBM9462609.1 glucose-6-phosphate isomerase [Aeromicrobium sp. YIM 150415]